MPRTVEDTVTQLFVSYFQDIGFDSQFKASIDLPRDRRGEPDIKIENRGIFYGEGEWENKEIDGFSQARDYGEAYDASGSFVILYPLGLKKDIKQTRLGEVRPEEILGKYKYTVAFLREGYRTDLQRLDLQGIKRWLERNIHEREPEPPDINEVVGILRKVATRLTNELGDIEEKPKLFKSVIGEKTSEKDLIEATRSAAGFLLVNQLAFYRVLSAEKGFPNIDPDSLRSLHDLQDEYFDKVLDEDYEPVFSFGVASEFSERTLSLIKNTIKTIYALKPEKITHTILGRVFHDLIPFSIRKKVAAFYTKPEACDILANLALENPEAKVIDPACGSGTLLVSSYNKKKEFLKSRKEFTEEDHKRFLEEEITGVDIMPFAAHLSTIHLALQAPVYETDEVRIGIKDSTSLKPGDLIPPLSRILPEARKQRTLEDFKSYEGEIVEAGSVKMGGKPGDEINLEKVDMVIMNPPFTRQESIADFSKEYKDKLERRFSGYEELIDRRMSYYNYFLLLADKFTEKEGKIAAVLPATYLRKDTDRRVRQYILDNYSIRFVILREDQLNFSESTNFREMLFIAEKGKEEENDINFVILKELNNNIKSTVSKIKKLSKETETGNIVKAGNLEIRKFKQNDLESRNLFQYVATSDFSLLELWKELRDSKRLSQVNGIFDTLEDKGVSRGEGDIKRGAETSRGGSIQTMSINHPKSDNLRRGDKWLFKKEEDDSILVRNRSTEDIIEIPKKAVNFNLRSFSGIKTMDINNRTEYIVKRRFEDIDRYIALAKGKSTEDVNLDFLSKWKSYVDDRTTNLAIVRRLHGMSAEGTSFLALHFDKERTAPGVMWSVDTKTKEEAKIICLWFNSTLNMLQTLVERVGTWMEIHKYILKEMVALDPKKLSEEEKRKFCSCSMD